LVRDAKLDTRLGKSGMGGLAAGDGAASARAAGAQGKGRGAGTEAAPAGALLPPLAHALEPEAQSEGQPLTSVQNNLPTWWVRLFEAALMPRLGGFSAQVNLGDECSQPGLISPVGPSSTLMVPLAFHYPLCLQELVTVLYGYGALRRRPPRPLMRAVLLLLQTRWRWLGSRGAANVLVATARIRSPPHAGWVRGLLREVLLLPASDPEGGERTQTPSDLTFEGAARILWALGSMRVDPGPSIMQLLVVRLEEGGGAGAPTSSPTEEEPASALAGRGIEREHKERLKTQACWGPPKRGAGIRGIQLLDGVQSNSHAPNLFSEPPLAVVNVLCTASFTCHT
jgi:hypothetical protein